MSTFEFQDFDAATVHKARPLLVGITSPSGGGKTYSALRLATGMRKVVGGDIFIVDTEADRALHYKDVFKFRHVPFAAPHSPERYRKALDYCLGRGAKVIIFDSMTHEHSGEGGVLDQVEEFLHKKAGEDWKARESYKWLAQVRPKAQRKALNNRIEQVGAAAIMIFCYRAEDKIKPGKSKREGGDGEPIHLGWTAETTSKLPYMMTVRFLLPPGADGHPNLKPDTEFEQLSIKSPSFFRDWFKPGLQLNEELGERLARWSVDESRASGVVAAPVQPTSGDPSPMASREQVEELGVEFVRLGMKPADASSWLLSHYKVKTRDALTSSQAIDALGTLMKMEATS